MSRDTFIKLLARRRGITNAAAADYLDRLVSDIVTTLKRGQGAPLPGLGEFQPGPVPSFRFEKPPSEGKRND